MPKIEAFIDNISTYCVDGVDFLTELLPKFPSVEVDWRQIEGHPKLEEPEHSPHVDLIVRGSLYIKDNGGDELGFIRRIFKVHFEEKRSIEDVSVLVECATDVGVDATAFEAALFDQKYEKAQLDANDYAYEKKGVWFVPTFVCDDIRLDAVEGIGVTKEQVEDFLTKCCK